MVCFDTLYQSSSNPEWAFFSEDWSSQTMRKEQLLLRRHPSQIWNEQQHNDVIAKLRVELAAASNVVCPKDPMPRSVYHRSKPTATRNIRIEQMLGILASPQNTTNLLDMSGQKMVNDLRNPLSEKLRNSNSRTTPTVPRSLTGRPHRA